MNKEKITIRDMILHLEWKHVKRAIKYFYPTDRNNYEPVFEQLKTIPKRKYKDPKEFIEVNCIWDLVPENFKEKYNETYYRIATNKYSMSFRRWKDLVNIPISEETLKHYTPVDIVAHFIWETTFYGNEKDTAKVEKKVFGAYKEAMKHKERQKSIKIIHRQSLDK